MEDLIDAFAILGFPIAVSIWLLLKSRQEINMAWVNSDFRSYSAYVDVPQYPMTWGYTYGDNTSNICWKDVPVLSDHSIVTVSDHQVDIHKCAYCGTPQRTKDRCVLLCEACGAPLV